MPLMLECVFKFQIPGENGNTNMLRIVLKKKIKETCSRYVQ